MYMAIKEFINVLLYQKLLSPKQTEKNKISIGIHEF